MRANLIDVGADSTGTVDIVPVLLDQISLGKRAFYLPEGKYLWNSNSYTMPKGFSLVGDGIGATEIICGPNTPYQVLTLDIDSELSGFSINAAGKTTLAPIISTAQDNDLCRLKLLGGLGMALDLSAGMVTVDRVITDGATTATYGMWFSSPDCAGVRISNSNLLNAHLAGLMGGAATITNCYFAGNAITEFGGQCAIGNATQKSTISNTIIDAGGSLYASGMEINGNIDIIGCHIRNQGNYGMVCEGGGNIAIIGGSVSNSGVGNASVRDGILVNDGVCDIRIIGTRCFDDQAIKTQNYGVRVQGGPLVADKIMIVGCDLDNNISGPYINESVGRVFVSGIYP